MSENIYNRPEKPVCNWQSASFPLYTRLNSITSPNIWNDALNFCAGNIVHLCNVCEYISLHKNFACCVSVCEHAIYLYEWFNTFYVMLLHSPLEYASRFVLCYIQIKTTLEPVLCRVLFSITFRSTTSRKAAAERNDNTSDNKTLVK